MLQIFEKKQERCNSCLAIVRLTYVCHTKSYLVNTTDMVLIQGTNNSDNPYNPPTDDTVYLGGGDDRFTFGYGNDTVSGGTGNDTIGTSSDSNSGGTVFGESGDDNLVAFYGREHALYGGDGEDFIRSGKYADSLFGGNDDDDLNGNGGNDRLYGEEGNDILVGSTGSDILVGGNGSDTLAGQLGSNGGSYRIENIDNNVDTLYGGGGADTFILGGDKFIPRAFYTTLNDGKVGSYYSLNGSNDYAEIEDFQRGVDKIQLTGASSNYVLGTSGSNTLIYQARNDDGIGNGRDELIGIAKNTGLSLNSDFIFT